GFLEARIGSSPHGQGLKTSLAQLIADEIGVVPSAIRVVAGDTDRSPYGWGTFASRSLVIAGGACKLAAATLRERLQTVASQILETAASDIEISRWPRLRARHRSRRRGMPAHAHRLSPEPPLSGDR